MIVTNSRDMLRGRPILLINSVITLLVYYGNCNFIVIIVGINLLPDISSCLSAGTILF